MAEGNEFTQEEHVAFSLTLISQALVRIYDVLIALLGVENEDLAAEVLREHANNRVMYPPPVEGQDSDDVGSQHG